ncbi:MAG: mechanosensitive ion channel domain-containing protein [Lentimicrobiaceae bacterium]
MELLMINFGEMVKGWLTRLGFAEDVTSIARDFTDFVIMIIIITAIYYLVKFAGLKIIRKITHRTSGTWDDALYNNHVFHKAAMLVPAMLFNVLAPYTLNEYPEILYWLLLLNRVLLVFITITTINKFLNAVYDIYQGFEISKSKPVKGYIQVLKIILYIIATLIVISMLFNKSPLYMLGGLGAFSAVLLLIFKDTILGFVGSIQISANDMVRPGDWVAMNKSGADGEVIDISLTTVKVQNWDKSITMIPTYSLVAESFVNWRGMEESGGRRIKRSINIDQHSIRFCTPEMIDKLRNIKLIKGYIDEKEQELMLYNQQNNIKDSVMVNRRRQTNLGIFRAYLMAYLHNLPVINKDMTFLVRQLQPGAEGIPLEIYIFSKVKSWEKYEDVQSDIFDHILASVKEFDLRVFQNPTGDDFRSMIQ